MKYCSRKKDYPQNLIDCIQNVGSMRKTSIVCESEDQKEGLSYVLSLFDHRTQEFVRLYFQEHKSLEQISSMYPVTRERVRQILHKALMTLSLKKNFGYIKYGYRGYNSMLLEKSSNTDDPVTFSELRSAYTAISVSPVSKMPIDLLGLPIGSVEALLENGYRTLEDLKDVSEEELLDIHMIGPLRAQRIVDSVKEICSMREKRCFAEKLVESVTFVPLCETCLSSRTQNALFRGGIKTIPDLLRCSDKDLLHLSGFGATGLSEVKQLLMSNYNEYVAIA